MLEPKKKKIASHKVDSDKKERHIVTWTPQEDDVLREQVRVHGTDNWSIIASKFKGKTTRQCRRRWCTYLNSDFKKGGWSPEEDVLLCEAQKVFGNRWTEIAKVVSGRTDNAVKNRFTTLCKKRAKCEALAKENNASCINQNGKRVTICSTSNSSQATVSTPMNKMLRSAHIQDASSPDDQMLRPQLVVLAPESQPKVEEKACNSDAQVGEIGEAFMSEDDPVVAALVEQAKLLSSLDNRVNSEYTEQSLENSWKVVQDFLDQSKDGDIFKYCNPEIDFQLQNSEDMVEVFTSKNNESQTSWRQKGTYGDSPASPQYSTGSSFLVNTTPSKTEEAEEEGKRVENMLHMNHSGEISRHDEHRDEFFSSAIIQSDNVLQSCGKQQSTSEGMASVPLGKRFSSPLQLTPVFRSFAAGIPSPKFSESERNFLMKTLKMESLSPSSSTNPVHPPSCKRVLLQSL
ncbi:hypothetical protein SAY86_025738 [Trapa natans]|uniref:Uncharacterized protein n=1 Tax=Trapa natans TaxID=22666 RepID=A0AAN7KHD4_TRANT|nr:hypothetical protein SAY86_025738 [Trapa natans]